LQCSIDAFRWLGQFLGETARSGHYPQLGERDQVHIDLAIAAIAASLTRVVGIQVGSEQSIQVDTRSIDGQPLQGDVHGGFIHGGAGNGYVQLKQWEQKVARDYFVYVCNKLAALPEPDGSGTLFDTTLVVWARDMGDSVTRNQNSMPFVLACGSNAYLKTAPGGRYVHYIADLRASGVRIVSRIPRAARAYDLAMRRVGALLIVAIGCGQARDLGAPEQSAAPVVAVAPRVRLDRPPVRLSGSPTWSNTAQLVALRYCPGDREVVGVDTRGNVRRFRTSDGAQLGVTNVGESNVVGPVVIECRADGTALTIGSDGVVLVGPAGALLRPPTPIRTESARFTADGSIAVLTDGSVAPWPGVTIRAVAKPATGGATLVEGGALFEHHYDTGSRTRDGTWLTLPGGKRTALANVPGPWGDGLPSAMAPDGAIVTMTDTAALLWDVKGGRRSGASRLVLAPGGYIEAIAASPRWVAVSAPPFLTIKDRSSGKRHELKLEQVCAMGRPALSLAISTDDTRIAVGCYDGLRVFDPASGQQLSADGVRSDGSNVAWSLDGARLATLADSWLRIWDRAANIATVWVSGWVARPAIWWDPANSVEGNFDDTSYWLGAWSFPGGQWRRLEPRVAANTAAADARGDVFVTGARADRLTIVHGSERRVLALPDGKMESAALVVDAAGTRAALVRCDRRMASRGLRCSEGEDLGECEVIDIDIASGHSTRIDAPNACLAAVDPDGAIVIVGKDGAVSRVARGKTVPTRYATLPAAVTALAVSRGLVAVGTTSSAIAIFDGDHQVGSLATGTFPAAALAFAPDGHRLAAIDADGTQIWDLAP